MITPIPDAIQRRLRDGNSGAKRRQLGKDMTYSFEHDVPVPAGHARQRWPLDQLPIATANKQGQLVGTCLRFDKDCVNTVRAATHEFRKANPGAKFTVRGDPADENSYRCWRVA
jgi:hypothetical protein